MAADASVRTREGVERINRYDEKAEKLEERMEWLENKIDNGRIRKPEHDRARAGYIRLYIKAVSEWRKLQNARDLEELTERVEQLEELGVGT